MAFKALHAVLDPFLRLPGNGKTYTIKAVSAEVGLWFHDLTEAGKALAQDAEAEADGDLKARLEANPFRDFNRAALGDVLDEMVADGLSLIEITHYAQTIMMWTVADEAAAEEFWNAGGKAQAPNREQRRTATRTRTAAASTTQKPASRSTTPTRNPAAANGPKSSSTGS